MSSETPVLTLPSHLSHLYRTHRFLGEGANGKTWLAQNVNNGQLVVIKLIKINDLKSIELYKREAEVLKSIQVQGVPRLYDTWISDDMNECMLIQEYIDAQSLDVPLESGRIFTEAETLDIILKVSEIVYNLQTLYTPPIIHRDIKPSNILYKEEKDGIRVSLIDFGAVANPQKRTGGSTIAGTLGYMPPEQIVGDVAIQSDYYAIGATALHLLTGVPPYQFESELYKLKYEETLKEKAPNLSMPMKSLLDILLSTDVANRPKNADLLCRIIRYVRFSQYKPSLWMRVMRKIRQLIKAKNADQYELKKTTEDMLKWLTQKSDESAAAASNVNKPNESNYVGKTSVSDGGRSKRSLEISAREINTIEKLTNEARKLGLQPRFAKTIEKWVECEGTIHCATVLQANNPDPQYQDYIENQSRPALEYTFDADGYTWCGFCAMPSNPFNAECFPMKCRVLYDPKNPRMNALYNFELRSV